MTMEDLREHGVLLPEEEWGIHRLETTVSVWPLVASFAGAAAGCVLMFLGGGGALTWIGVVAFLVLLFLITWLCDRAVVRQRERSRRERRAA